MEQFYDRAEQFIRDLWALRDDLFLSFYPDELDNSIQLVAELFDEHTWWSQYRLIAPQTSKEKMITCTIIVLAQQIIDICKLRVEMNQVSFKYLVQLHHCLTNPLYEVTVVSSQTDEEYDDVLFQIVRKQGSRIHGEVMPVFVKDVIDIKDVVIESSRRQLTLRGDANETNDSASSSSEDSDVVSRNSKRKGKRSNFPKQVRAVLKNWLFLHSEDPFPTETEKVKLTKQTKLTMNQLNNWFINARRRYLRE